MTKGFPQLASKSATWLSKNAPWSQPVQRSVAGAATATLGDQTTNPASDNGLMDETRRTATKEGSLAAQLRGFAVPAGDFNAGWMSNQKLPSKSWKP